MQILEGSKQWCLTGFEHRAIIRDKGSIPLPSA